MSGIFDEQPLHSVVLVKTMNQTLISVVVVAANSEAPIEADWSQNKTHSMRQKKYLTKSSDNK